MKGKIMNELKTFRVLMAETHAQYYEVQAIDEDLAVERAYDYDEDKPWALDTWDEGITNQDSCGAYEVKEKNS